MSPTQPYRLDADEPPPPKAGRSVPKSAPSPMPLGPSFATQPLSTPIAPRTPPPPPLPKPQAPAPAIKPRREPRGRVPLAIGLGTLGTIAVVTAAFVYLRADPRPAAAGLAAAESSTGVVTVDSRPEGTEVSVDGRVRGTTPLRLSLPTGDHVLEFHDGSGRRTLPVTVSAGLVLSEHIDLSPVALATSPAVSVAAAMPASATTGQIDVTSTPTGAQVTVDDLPRGVTPLSIAGLAPGAHTVVVSGSDGSVTNSVMVTAGAKASIAASLAQTAAGGWLTIKAPFEMQILEGDRVIGTSTLDRIMLPPGKHDLQLVSAAFDFKAPLSVRIRAGQTETPAVPIPNGSLSINAQPWADVWLDGQSLGTTPLANVAVAIGNHELVWRHPQLGERRRTIAVTQTPMRLGLDFTDRRP